MSAARQHPIKTYTSALFPNGTAADLRVGTYEYHPSQDKLVWSEEAFQLHGFRSREIVPTIELAFAHIHADDQEGMRKVMLHALQAGAPFTSYYRLLDSRKRLHRVLATGAASIGGNGKVERVSGWLVDLTSTVRLETAAAAEEAVRRSSEHRAVIEQAKGILMDRFHVSDQAAFEMLLRTSQASNRKLRDCAADLVADTVDPAEGGQVDDGEYGSLTG